MKKKRFLSIMLSLAVMLSFIPALGTTAKAAGGAYSAYVPTGNETEDDLSAKRVKLGNDWFFLIKDNSTSATSGTVTLFASYGLQDDYPYYGTRWGNTYKYSTCSIKGLCDGFTNAGGKFDSVANAIVDSNVPTYPTSENINVTQKMYIPDKSEAESLPLNVRTYGCDRRGWWTRSPYPSNSQLIYAVNIDGSFSTPQNMSNDRDCRPFLKLDLSKVSFDSTDREFTAHQYNVSISACENATASGGSTNQTLSGSIKNVVYTANDGYYFPENYSVAAVNGISVTRNSYSKITVAGRPSADATITLPGATAKTKPDTPATVAGVNCTGKDTNDGKITGVTSAMEYKLSDETSWKAVQGEEITGLAPGKYFVRIKATNTSVASDIVEVMITKDAKSAIESLPAATEVTTDDKDDIEAARIAYDVLSEEEKENLGTEALEKLEAAEVALSVVEINALPETAQVTAENKEAIEEARKTYDGLTDAQKESVGADALNKLEAAEVALSVVEINDLPAANEVTTENKKAIEEARKTYDSLTADQKNKVEAETLQKLEAAEVALTEAEINALPEADKVTTSDKQTIEEARKTYDALTAAQKKNVSSEALKKLTDAEDALAVASVNEEIDALPAADNVTTANKEAIEAARKEYDALTAEQKKNVSSETLKKLTDAESALAVALVNEKLSALPEEDKVTVEDKAAVEEARKAYNALKEEEKEKVDPAVLEKLETAEVALSEAEMNALPDAEKVTVDDKAAIEEARKTYDALTKEQKEKVGAEALEKLEAAEVALAEAEINALPDAEKVTVNDKAAIEAARKTYDSLTEDQKAKVPADIVKKLEDAEKALAEAEKKEAEDKATSDKDTKAAKELKAAKKIARAAMNAEVAVTQKGKKITIKWKKAKSADGYDVYVQYCGKKFKKPVKRIKKNTITKVNVKKVNGKKINLKKQFKVYVVSYKMIDGKKVVLAKSVMGHVVGVKNKNYTNVKSLKLKKKAYTVKVGKTVKVKAKDTLVDKSKKHIPSKHVAKFRYRSSDKSIATVNKNGKIKGVKKGKCKIYVYAVNGKMKKATVTVK